MVQVSVQVEVLLTTIIRERIPNSRMELRSTVYCREYSYLLLRELPRSKAETTHGVTILLQVHSLVTVTMIIQILMETD